MTHENSPVSISTPTSADITTVAAPRRDFLRQGIHLATGAALMGLLPPGIRHGAWAAGSDAPEKKEVRIG